MPQDIVSSAKNPLLADVRRAVRRGERTTSGACVAEGFNLLEEAIRSECRIEAVLAAASVRTTVEGHVRGLKKVRVIVLGDSPFQAVSATESTQGVITLVHPPEWNLDSLFRARPLVVVLDGIQDPGNAGTILRAAEAFGATGALFVKGSVSPYNPKALRASAGSVFRLPILTGVDPDLARAALEQKRVDVYSAVPRGGKSLIELDLTRGIALVVGSEARGVSTRLRSAALDVRIPTAGVESLNAAMAAGIILYEASRQRILRK